MPEKEIVSLTPERSVRERCGVIGLYSLSLDRDSQVNIAVQLTIGLWHRGQQGAGLTIKDKSGLITHHGEGQPEQTFSPNIVNALKEGKKPSWIIAQTRYGTYGDWNKTNLQPMTAESINGEVVTVAHNGQFTDIETMKDNVSEDIPYGASDTYIFSRLLAKAKGSSWDEKIISTLKKSTGAYSLVIGVGDSLYFARDPQGIRPLVLGKIGNGFIAASETHALDKVGASTIRQIKRGEIVKIDSEGAKIIKEGLEDDGNFCDFEWNYFSRPDSLYPVSPKDYQNPESWKSVYEFREQCGITLAEEHRIYRASFVTGISDSGIPVSIGYANALGIPYRQLFIRDHYDPNGKDRLFQTDYDISGIQKRVPNKLSLVPNKKIWKDAIVVLGDDSIVRGDTSKVLTQMVFNAGAKEVHWIVGFPQIMHPCHLGVSMRTHERLIAHNNGGDPEKIAEAIGATTVRYISPQGFIRARLKSGKDLVMPQNINEIFLANGGCGGCVTGLYPISKEGIIYQKYESKS